MSKSNAGRHNKYFTHVQPRLQEIAEWCKEGLIEKEICKRLGVAVSSFAVYKNQYMELLDSLKLKAEADYQVVNSLFKRATGYEFEETTKELVMVKDKDGLPIYEAVFDSKGHPIGHTPKYEMKITKVVKKELPPDPTSMIFWTKNRMPQEWKDKQDVDLNIKEMPEIIIKRSE